MMGADPNMRVLELCALFIEDSRTNGNKPKTIQDKKRYVEGFIVPLIGHVKLRDVGHEHIAKVYENAKLTSAPTLLAVHRITNRMFNYAIENMMVITKNPVSKGLAKQVNGFVNSFKANLDTSPRVSVSILGSFNPTTAPRSTPSEKRSAVGS